MAIRENFFNQKPQTPREPSAGDVPHYVNGHDALYWQSLIEYAETGPKDRDEVLDGMVAEIQAPRDNALPSIFFEDIQPNMDAADFVEGMLIEGSMAVVYGESNCGKTFFMTDLSLHVAMGKTWRGLEVEQGGVIYCALEGSHGISNRVAAFRKYHQLEGQRLPFAIVPYSLNMLDPEADTQRLIDTIRDVAEPFGCPVKMLVIDTLARALAGGNENAPDDMGALVINTDKVRQATGACVVYIHHSGKDTARGARGHSSLRAATDTEIEISREDIDAPSVAIAQKQREMEIGGEFWFKLERIELGTNRRNKPVASCVVTEVEKPSGQTGRDSKKSRLPDGASLAMRALISALSKAGAKLPPTADYPRDTFAVSAGTWRDEFYQLKSGTQDTKKHAFSRAEDLLLARNIITQRNGLVWPVKRDKETGHAGQ